MAHGYLREYDEGWDRGDDRDRERGQRDRDEFRGRSDRDWRDRDPVWRSDREDENDRGRGFMLGDEDRGFFSRAGDDDRRDQGAWENNRDWPQRDRGFVGYARQEQRGFGGSNEWREGQRSYSANPDDHYRSWRDRQMQSLDRDYQDYCREREQQFHQDFDTWRQNRQQPRRTGGNEDELILGSQQQPQAPTAGNTPSPTDSATLGTNNSENSGTGRGRRQAE